MIPEEIKHKIEQQRDLTATKNGYPSYEELYNWVSRDGQYPAVVAQLIESFTEEVVYNTMQERIKELEAQLSQATKRLQRLENPPNNIDY